MIDNKLIISYGGMIAMVPAKPILTLAAIGAITVCAATYCIFNVSGYD